MKNRMITKMTRGLKAVLPLLMLAILFSACSKDDDVSIPQVTVGFDQEEYGIPFGGEVIIRVQSDKAVDQDVTVPFSITGSLAASDYSVAENAFVIKKGNKEAQVKINVLKDVAEDDFLEVQLNSAGSNVKFGTQKAKVAVLAGDVIIYSFEKEDYIMTETAVVTLNLSTIKGFYTAEKDMTFELELDEESTAIEGTHFNFANGNTITVPAGKTQGSVTLNFIGEKPVEGKDLVILKLKNEGAHLKPGNFYKANVSIFGSIYNQLVGSWKFKAFSNREYTELNTGGTDPIENLPVNNTAADVISFDEDGIKVSMTGDLGNYFRNSAVTYIKEEIEVLQEVPGLRPPRVNIVLVKALANVAFSKTTIDEREAEIGFRVFTEGGKQFLEVTIRDYEPTDFLQLTYNTWKGLAADGDVAMKYMPLRFHFEKVN